MTDAPPSPHSPTPSSPQPAATRSCCGSGAPKRAELRNALVLRDLTDELVWPHLLRAPVLALDAGRLGLAFVAVLVFTLLLHAASWATAGEDTVGVDIVARVAFFDAVDDLAQGAVGLDAARLAEGVIGMVVGVPGAIVSAAPIVGTALVALVLLGFALVAGAICRMAACDFAAGVKLAWTEGLGFAVSRFRWLATAIVAPLVVIWIVALLLRVAGWIGFGVPVLDVIAGALFGLALLMSLVAVGVGLAFVLGWPMLVPAVSADVVDGVDAIQRAYAYVFGRPLRLVLYSLLLLVQGAVMLAVVAAVCLGVVRFALDSTTAWSGEPARVALGVSDADAERVRLNEQLEAKREQLADFRPGEGEYIMLSEQIDRDEKALDAITPGSTRRASGALVRLWSVIPLTIPAAFGLSYLCCASTMLYLAMRRLNDGQDVRDIWMPGLVPGTHAETGSGVPAADTR